MQKNDLIKRLFFNISKSFTLNFILAIITIFGIVINLFSTNILKVLCIFLTLEILFVDANLFFKCLYVLVYFL